MAEELTTESTTGAKHNAKSRADMIRKLSKELRPYEQDIDEAKAAMKKLRKDFTTDTGITMRDFDAARRLADIEEDEERHTKLDNLAECYSALRPGEQLDWVQAAEQQDAEAPNEPAAA